MSTENIEQKPSVEKKQSDNQGLVSALNKVQAVIEFKLDGTILTANQNFLKALGYSLEEIRGKHHRIFCDPEYVKTEEYTNLWKKLASGSHEVGEFNRFTKDGKEIWINASYNPVLNSEGKPVKVVKICN